MKWFLTCLCFLMPVLAAASDYPALFDVTDVASDDVLNLRAEPDASAALIGTLAYDAKNIEVVASNDSDTWGQINLGETSGWVSLRYLERHPDNPDYALAKTLVCYGAEPGWSATFQQGMAVKFSSMSGEYETPGAGLIVSASGRFGVWGMAYGDSTAIFRRETCSDGMSDRHFGLSGTLFKQHDGIQSVLTGCCSITQH